MTLVKKRGEQLKLDTYPYFPLPLEQGVDEEWEARSPLDDEVFELNAAGASVVRCCNGYLSLEEIIERLARAHRQPRAAVIGASRPLLETLTSAGLLWWRSAPVQQVEVGPPQFVQWDLTSRCNLRCRHCVVSAGSQRGGDDLSLSHCKRLVEELAELGLGHMVLSGGEPLLRPDFFEIAEHAASRGLTFQLATNATRVSRKSAARLAQIGATTQVSLESSVAEIHDRFRGVPGAWKRAIAGIRNLVAEDVHVMIAATVTQDSFDHLLSTYELAIELGARAFRVLPFVPFGRGATARELEVDPDEMRRLTERLHELREVGPLHIPPLEFECTLRPPPRGPGPPEARIGCDGAVAYCTIKSNGEVVPCNFFDGVEAMKLQDHSFAEIWWGAPFLRYFRSLKVSDLRGVCRSCDWLPDCRGSCIAANFTRRDIFQSNCHCWRVR